LRCEQLQEVLQIELRKVQSRVSNAVGRPFLFRITEEARQFLLDKGTDQRYGARHLKRAIERFLIYPLATLLATNQLRPGDLLIIDRPSQKECLAFVKTRRASGFLSVRSASGSELYAPNEHGDSMLVTKLGITPSTAERGFDT
jgi:hypothetical protein